MKLFVLLLSVLSVSSSSALPKKEEDIFKIDHLEYGFCSDVTNEYLANFQMSLDPFPVIVATGASLTYFMNVDIIKSISPGAKVSLKLVKEGLIPITIPCINGFGSCSYDLDELLADISEEDCQANFPEGQECGAPLNPGTYGPKEPIIVEIGDVPDSLIGLASGTYSVKITTKVEGSEISCVKVKLAIKNKALE